MNTLNFLSVKAIINNFDFDQTVEISKLLIEKINRMKTDVIYINNPEEYDELKSKGLVIVDFNTSWCDPCKKFAPIFARMAKRHSDIVFLSVDIEKIKHEECSRISSIPSFKIFLDGVLKKEFSGLDSEKLERYISHYLSVNEKELK